ncbi:MAG: outer membrane protein transport protein, partial [Myxococcota bacterium]|nr:outer membrane protein transport protein [Myxococcota bacterium]
PPRRRGLEPRPARGPRVVANVVVTRVTARARVGVHMRPASFYELGLAVRPLPTQMDAEGDVSLSFPNGTLSNMYEKGNLKLVNQQGDDEYGIRFKYTLPPWIRLGQRLIKRDAEGREVADLELDISYEFWRVMDAYHVTFNGLLQVYNSTEVLEPMSLKKDWKDTIAVRLGGSWSLLPDRLKLRGGVHYETGAMPETLTNIDFLAYTRMGGAIGLGLTLGPVEVNVAYQHVFQPTREITDSQVAIQRPLDPADEPLYVGNGTYESSFQTLALGLSAQF